MSDVVTHDAWIRRFHHTPEHAATLVCFPHAGGAATYFRSLAEALRPDVAVLGVQYPGRQDRLHEPCLTTVAGIADEAFRTLEPLMDRPTAFLGHSMGAIVAFEVATRMKRLGRSPLALFVSGRPAPSVHRDGAVHLLDDTDLVEHLRRTNGTDGRLLADETVLQMILPSVRGDYTAIETYEYRAGPKLECPVTALYGDEDDAVTAEEIQAWADHTTDRFTARSFPGGHFYLADHPHGVADLIAHQLRNSPE
jgi:pyochelin biosynthesis protein PchC